jgi:uncharacterized membrane protein
MSARTRRLRRAFFTGLVVVAPVGLTVFVLAWTFRLLDGILGGVLENTFGVRIPGLGVMVLALGVLGIGWIVQLAAGRQFLNWWNQALSRFPLTGRIYDATSQIVQTVVGERKRIFHRAVLVPYPTEDMWAVAFVTNESAATFEAMLGETCVNVFVPTTPNPTSGFMLIVPTRKLRVPDISVEDAMKLVISAGAVLPRSRSGMPHSRGLDLEHLLRDTQEYRVE